MCLRKREYFNSEVSHLCCAEYNYKHKQSMTIFVVKGICSDFLWYSFTIEASFSNYLRPGVLFHVKAKGNSVYTLEPCRGLKMCCMVRWGVLISRRRGGSMGERGEKIFDTILKTYFP